MFETRKTKSARSAAGNRKPWALSAAALALLMAPAPFLQSSVRASDHADTAENASRPGADISDVFIFPSSESKKDVVLVMNVRPLIPRGQGKSFSFDPDVLYQFKIDTSGDSVEDLVVQVKFSGTGKNQKILVAGPARPSRTGTVANLLPNFTTLGVINQQYTVVRLADPRRSTLPPTVINGGEPGSKGLGAFPSTFQAMRVFAGAREDPFFFDLERFTLNQADGIFPDRRTPLEPPLPRTDDKTIPNPNAPQSASFRSSNEARDFLKDFNVLSIVVELPRAALGGGVIRLWETTSPSSGGGNFTQQDRLARPVVNEALATVSNNRHKINNRNNPTDDPSQLANDIESFLTFPANRSRAIKDVIKAVLVPDVMIADLSQSGPASYLGVETNGATGGKFGGRALSDDVVDISLGIVFGTTISDLGLAPADGNQIPALTTDNVGVDKHFIRNFPYLGDPQ